MKRASILSVLGFSIILSACSSNEIPKGVLTKEIPVVHEVKVDKPKPIVPKIDQFKAKPVVWKIIPYEGKPWFALDAEGYKNVSLNSSSLRKLVQQQQSIIRSLSQ